MNLADAVSAQKAFFESGATRGLEFRLARLRELEDALRRGFPSLAGAVYADFKKSEFEVLECELLPLLESVRFAAKNLKKWMKPRRVRTNFPNFPARSFAVAEPLGAALVMGAWNYPFYLSFGPAVGAMAAGCTVVLKPSELAPTSSAAIADLVSKTFDPRFFCVAEGGPETGAALLDCGFDKIFFTGGGKTGRIVLGAAAGKLTPATLELGGKSPAIVHSDCRLDVCARRVVWAKFLNAGQTCVAPDYALVHNAVKADFLRLAKAEIEKARYGVENGNYVQIINRAHTERLAGLIAGMNVYCGGGVDLENRLVEPTLINGARADDPVMREEIFGPVLPVIGYDSLEEAVGIVKSRPAPLACYVFTSDGKVRDRIVSEIPFGGGAVNDAVMHLTNERLPFGGVGASGMGAYHGKAGFDTFSHYKGVLDKPAWFEWKFKYPPYSEKKAALLRRIFGL